MDFVEWRILSFTLLEARYGFYLRVASTDLKITFELNTIWIDIDRRSPITSVCGSDVTSAVYKNRSQLQDAASIWFLLEACLIFDTTCGFYLRFMSTIWEQKTDRRLLLWIRCNAGRTQTALNYKMRLLFDLQSRFVAAVCVRKVKAPFFYRKASRFWIFQFAFDTYLSFYMFLMHNGAKQSWIH